MTSALPRADCALHAPGTEHAGAVALTAICYLSICRGCLCCLGSGLSPALTDVTWFGSDFGAGGHWWRRARTCQHSYLQVRRGTWRTLKAEPPRVTPHVCLRCTAWTRWDCDIFSTYFLQYLPTCFSLILLHLAVGTTRLPHPQGHSPLYDAMVAQRRRPTHLPPHPTGLRGRYLWKTTPSWSGSVQWTFILGMAVC